MRGMLIAAASLTAGWFATGVAQAQQEQYLILAKNKGFSEGFEAADDDAGIVGVAPEAEIVHVKAGLDSTGRIASSTAMAGIYYAANIGADVINMSFGGYFWRSGAFFIDAKATAATSMPGSGRHSTPTIRARR